MSQGDSSALVPRPSGLLRARSADEREFLPAALEVMETPASPAGRAVALTICAFFALAIAWAAFGRVDIIATAPGKIVPTGRSKVIQPFETGVVRAVHVQEGQTVKAGDVLVELDPTEAAAERDRLQSELTSALLDAARLRAALSDAPDPAAELAAPVGATADQLEVNRQFLLSLVAEHHAKLAALDRQIAQQEANHAAVAATVQKLEVSIPLLQQRVDMRRYLTEKELGSKILYLQEEQDLVEHQQELQVQKNRLLEAESALAALREQRLEADAEYRRTNLEGLSQAEQKARSLAENLKKAEERRELQTLRAPVDGVVQQIAVHTVGGVVTPAEPLMVVVPADSKLEIEATVQNQDIGFVRAGEPAQIKVDTFNFTRYGLLRGTVTNVSEDAMVRERAPGGSAAGAAAGASSSARESEDAQTTGQDLVYTAHVSLDRTEMQVEDKLVKLAPGMAVTVEIKTGQRRVIEYLLSPLLRYKQEALRER
jgi:hemolysin D